MNLSVDLSIDYWVTSSPYCSGNALLRKECPFANAQCLSRRSISGSSISSSTLTQWDRWPTKSGSHLSRTHGLRTGQSFEISSRRRRRAQLFAVSMYGKSEAAATIQSGKYQRVGECLVYPPFPRSRPPKGIIKFLGGAFIGASPDITYSHFIELLAKEGFVIVAVPHNITFDHTAQARGIHFRFNEGLSILFRDGVPRFGLDPDELSKLQIFCVGHSNGALMQVLVGSLCTDLPGKLPKANAIISFNNKPAAGAVPFFNQMGPTLRQAVPLFQSSPLARIATNLAAEAQKLFQNNSVPLSPGIDNNTLQSAQQFFDQIPSVFGQVTDGVTEFTPTPLENRETISLKYCIPNNLLIKFTVDSIDETDELENSIKLRSSLLDGAFKKLILTGTHATPLALDPKWEVGKVYTPFDALGQAFRLSALADLRILAKLTGDWFGTLS